MNKPYIACYMMTSIDGRIDCPVMEKLPGCEVYDDIFRILDVKTNLNGKTTAELELAEKGVFECKEEHPLNEETFSKKVDSDGYDIIVDTRGTLLWKEDKEYENPHIILLSEKVSQEYLSYLDSKNISYIVIGRKEIDLVKATEILHDEFHIQRMIVTGGGRINAAFLKASLLDEVVILYCPGIDGRNNMTAAFDGLEEDYPTTILKLTDVQKFDSGAVLLRYRF